MADHYNAFISYRHAPRDMKVAETIQNDLEHFPIPAKQKKKSGIRSIHIFRDKNELGTASDLSTEIANALDNSDYLIVICSTSVKESAWVPREIAYFLQSHPRRNVLTVLADGDDPTQVIPEMLTYEDQTLDDGYGNAYTVRVPMEPLSCDYRPIGTTAVIKGEKPQRASLKELRRARHQELPRLASALIGCSYDDLMNRRRKARMHRMTAIFAGILVLAAAFGFYLYTNNNRLEKSLQTSLRNQSIYLASESRKMLDNEQRLLAMQLAIASLPQDEDDKRPLIPQAVSALNKATLAYTTKQDQNIHCLWNFTMPNQVTEMRISPTRGQVAGVDSEDRLMVWDIQDHNLTLSIGGSNAHLNSTPENHPVDKIFFLNSNALLSWDSHILTAHDPETGKLLWSHPFYDDDKHDREGISINGDIYEMSDGSFTILTTKNRVLRLSGEDGSELASYTLPGMLAENELDITQYLPSPDETKIAYIGYIYDMTSFKIAYTTGVLDTKTGEHRELPVADGRYRDMIWADNDRLLAACAAESIGSSGQMGDRTILVPDHTTISCLNVNTMTANWEYDFVSNDVLVQSGFLLLPKQDGVAYFCANKAELFKLDDGSLIASHFTNSPIVSMTDVDGDGWPIYISRNGEIVQPQTTKSVYLIPVLARDLLAAEISNGIFLRSKGSCDILYYGLSVWDDSWAETTGCPPIAYQYSFSDANNCFLDTAPDGSTLALLTTENVETLPEAVIANIRMPDGSLARDQLSEALLQDYLSKGVPLLTLIDTGENHLKEQIILLDDPEDSSASLRYSILGTHHSHLYLSYNYYAKGYYLIDLDLNSGEMQRTRIMDSPASNDVCSLLQNGKLIFAGTNDQYQTVINAYSVETGELRSYVIDPELTHVHPSTKPIYFPETNSVYFNSDDKGDWIVPLSDEKPFRVPAPEAWGRVTYAAYGSFEAGYAKKGTEGKYAVTNGYDILLITPGSQEVQTISCMNVTPTGMAFYPSKFQKKGEAPVLLVVYSDGNLYRYNGDTGELIAASDISSYKRKTESASFLFQHSDNLKNGLSDNKVYIQVGNNLNIVDTNEWVESAVIQSCIGYQPFQDKFYTVAFENTEQKRIGCFHQYTVEELLVKAKDYLRNAQLPDEIRSEYGLEDIEEDTETP